MPEGPSIVILKELVQQFKGKKVMEAGGNTKAGLPDLKNLVVVDFKSWGKHFLICFKTFTIRIHFLLFGTYRINEGREKAPRLALRFAHGELNLYACSVQLIDKPLDEIYDWSADVMNDLWDPVKAKQKILSKPERLVCDILMDQQIFSGVGNIIKNEVLFRIKVHPGSKAGKLPATKLNALLKESVRYSFEFLEWKKAFVLKQHWLVYNKKVCPRDDTPLSRKNMGVSNRRTFFCRTCQRLYV